MKEVLKKKCSVVEVIERRNSTYICEGDAMVDKSKGLQWLAELLATHRVLLGLTTQRSLSTSPIHNWSLQLRGCSQYVVTYLHLSVPRWMSQPRENFAWTMRDAEHAYMYEASLAHTFITHADSLSSIIDCITLLKYYGTSSCYAFVIKVSVFWALYVFAVSWLLLWLALSFTWSIPKDNWLIKQVLERNTTVVTLD